MCSASATEKKDEKPPTMGTVKKDHNGGGSVAVPSYWGIETAKMKIARKDGSKWPWNSFMVSLIMVRGIGFKISVLHILGQSNFFC